MMAMAAALLFLLFATPAAVYAVDHVVGGSNGWTNSGDYTTWASGETFTVGDNLVFNYGGSHGVDQVSQADYDNCATGNAIQSHTGGRNSIPLSTAGPMYFFCPSFGHCQQGMKLAVTVAAAGSTPGGSPTPTTPSTPSGSNSPGTPSTPTTPSGSTSGHPSPRANGAAGKMNGRLVVGFSILAAAVLGFRG